MSLVLSAMYSRRYALGYHLLCLVMDYLRFLFNCNKIDRITCNLTLSTISGEQHLPANTGKNCFPISQELQQRPFIRSAANGVPVGIFVILGSLDYCKATNRKRTGSGIVLCNDYRRNE